MNMRPGHWIGSLLCDFFSALTLTTRTTACESLCYLFSKFASITTPGTSADLVHLKNGREMKRKNTLPLLPVTYDLMIQQKRA